MHTHYIDQDLHKQALIKEAFTTLTNTSRSPQLYVLSYLQKLMIFAGYLRSYKQLWTVSVARTGFEIIYDKWTPLLVLVLFCVYSFFCIFLIFCVRFTGFVYFIEVKFFFIKNIVNKNKN